MGTVKTPMRLVGSYFDPAKIESLLGGTKLALKFLGGGSVLLLHCNGADGSTTFTDSALRHTMTAVGSAQIDTAQKQFGSGSGLFDGTTDAVACWDNLSDFDFSGSKEFTIDCWVYLNEAMGGNRCLMWKGGGVGDWTTDDGHQFILSLYGGALYFQWNNGGAAGSINAVVDIDGGWHHVAVVNSTAHGLHLHLDGITIASTVKINMSYVSGGTNGLVVGGIYTVAPIYSWKGWIDEVRVLNGVAAWIADFAVPVAEYASTAYDSSSPPIYSVMDSGVAASTWDMSTFTDRGDNVNGETGSVKYKYFFSDTLYDPTNAGDRTTIDAGLSANWQTEAQIQGEADQTGRYRYLVEELISDGEQTCSEVEASDLQDVILPAGGGGAWVF
jgi:hypothetical protein